MATTTVIDGKRVYKAGFGRKLLLTASFLLFLPFFVALPMMAIQRITAGYPGGAVMPVLVFIVMALCLGFILVNLISAYRTRLELGEQAVHLTMPAWRGPTPGLVYKQLDIPYGDIAKIEHRHEIYKEVLVPQLMHTAAIVTKDGTRHRIGYTQDTSEDQVIPVGEMAEAVARRAGVPLVEKASVRAGSQLRRLIAGEEHWGETDNESDINKQVTQDEYNGMIKSNHGLMFGIAALVLGLALITLAVDLGRHGFFNAHV